RLLAGSIGEQETLTCVVNLGGAVFSPTLARSKKNGCLADILDIQTCPQIAVLVIDFTIAAGGQR
ncbi:MAG: hypothetical protein J6Q60_09170, partial [Bacteroidaceae bacterium]|nr:hypothetical protein [Bacteroidaceae bacterium]